MPTTSFALSLSAVRDRSSRGRARSLLALGFVLWASWIGSAATASTPVVPVPASRWGTLEPRAILMDTSWYLFNFEPGCAPGPTGKPPYWVQSVALEGDLLVAATGNHVAAWDVSNPAAPVNRFTQCRPTRVPCCASDVDWFFNQVAMPAGDPTLAVIAGHAGLGLVVLDTGSPALPVYQDTGFNVSRVAVVTRPTAPRKVAAVYVGVETRFALYDLDKAKTANCYDRTFAGGAGDCTSSKSAYLGQSPITVTSRLQAVGRYLVTGHSNSIEVWDFGNSATSPTLVGSLSVSTFLRGVAAWEQGGRLHLAAGHSQHVDLYRFPSGLSCGGPCQPTLVATLSTPGGTISATRKTDVDSLRVSQDGGRHYLYVGSGGVAGSGPQREWLFDVTDPALADDLTPPHPDGYWGWYYLDNGGFENINPGDGVVGRSHLYRATSGLLDVHAILLDAPPVANFTWSPGGTIYLGDTVQFFDQSTRDPNLWHWTFGSVANDSVQNPVVPLTTAAGYTPGQLDVTLVATNDVGSSDPVSKAVQIVNPAPTLAGVGASPTSATPCASVEFTAQDPAGKPPLGYTWEVLHGGTVVATDSGQDKASLVYQVPSHLNSGTLTARLTLSNSTNSTATKTSPGVSLSALAPLGQPTFSYDSPVTNGLAQFDVSGDSGATRWVWSWGDGTQSGYDLASQGRNPTHQYTQPGTYDVTVTVSNCVEPSSKTSTPVSVEVPPFEPLAITKFSPLNGDGVACQTIVCQVVPGSTVNFEQTVGGLPELYEYDWDGNGTWDQSSSSPVTSHFYPSTTQGSLTPRMKITRGGDSLEKPLDRPLSFATSSPPTVSVSGPASLTPGQSGTFGAAATGCTPTGWSWSASGGGVVSGAGSTVSIAWGSTGTKTVTATALGSACFNEQDSHNVSVTSSSGGGGGGGSSTLTARFTRSPTGTVNVGQQVSFNASTSSGSPTTYTWDFGDGGTASSSSANINHTYTETGTFTVVLEVAKAGDCSFNLCTHSTSATVQVSTGGAGGGSGGPSQGSSELAAKFTFGPTSPFEEDEIHFDASGSTGSPSSYSWDFGDGATGNGKNVTHAYQTAGSYTVKLTVKKFAVSGCGDDNLCTHSVTKKVTVEPLQRDGDCEPGPNTLCLRNRRFEVSIELTGQPESTFANTVPGQTGDSGLFWFFDPSNWEVLVKVLDGCEVTGSYWVFAASTTDQGYILTVTDRSEDHDGTSVQYVNQPGNPAPAITDTGALAVCEAPPQ
jgi:PKD repeat protein